MGKGSREVWQQGNGLVNGTKARVWAGVCMAAGIVGSVLAKEGRISNVTDFFSGAFKIVLKQIQRDDSPPSSAKPQRDSLLAQVNSLRQELQLLASNRSVTVITASGSGASTYGVPVVVVVVVGYGYIWWKGWKLSDMMFATRRTLSDACTTVAKQLEQVSSSITANMNAMFGVDSVGIAVMDEIWEAAKRHLSSRIDRVDSNLDECAELTAATRDEVSQLRGDMKVFSVDVESVHLAETKIGRIEGKQASPSSSSRPALELPQITPTSRTVSLPPKVLSLEPPSPSASNQSPKVSRPLQSAASDSGLKELQGIADALNSSTGPKVLNGTPVSEDKNSNGSSSSSSSRFGWKFPGLNASFLARTHNK
ncbi:hypothetical protein HHK36_015864 [Tetracentron sinense]|uniref:DUF1664 domain-containing protein n=1 Tax=Tetracentron sinense TaxID=13715 RepID=A0A835DEA2_TETSI|nr:hypothetical protein HHK36_015864 [Tetracentron sinense]